MLNRRVALHNTLNHSRRGTWARKTSQPLNNPLCSFSGVFCFCAGWNWPFRCLKTSAAWGTLGPFEAFWGLLGPIVVKTALMLGPSGDYRGLLRFFGVCVSKKPFLGRYMYGDSNSVR